MSGREGGREGGEREGGRGETHLTQELSTEHRHARRPVSHLIILGLGNVHEDFSCRVIDVNGFEDGGPVVGHLVGEKEGGRGGGREGGREGGSEGGREGGQP